MPLTPGQQLGAYEIVCSLGAGGMGEVYRARDAKLGREVALKVLPPEVVSEPGRLERFDREARAIAALNHPHIVTIYSTEDADGIRFLTMELVEGSTLSDLVMSGGMAVARFLDIAIPLADALAAAHQKQITHRDLKPGNVMVSSDGRVKVLDFGLARIGGGDVGDDTMIATRAPITSQGVIVGTMPYMSPEQVEGQPVDPRSDLFSLGVIFYELLSGDRPFKGSSSPALMSAILRDTPPGLCGRRSDIPATLERLVARLLEKRPEDRVQTARDVFNELRHLKKTSDSSPGVVQRLADRSTKDNSIAVLPFSDLSEKKDQDWFCDGIAEEILNALAPLPGLRVAARASAFSFRGKTDDLKTIGEKLNVRTVLEGSVRRFGDRVRITTQLSDVQEGRQLWSERFDRELKDIFDVQEEIARAIVARLQVTLSDSDRLVQKPTSNMEAYQQLLQGRVFMFKRGPAIANAIPCFERAIALDPNLAEAHAGLGDAYRLMGIYGLLPPTEVLPQARQSLERALALDPDQPDALATMANISHAYEWNFAASKRLTERALAVDPSHVRTIAESAIMTATAMAEPASPELRQFVLDRSRRARALDPLNAWVMAMEALNFSALGMYDVGIDAAARAIETDAANFTAHWSLMVALAGAQRDEDAEAAAEASFKIFKRHPSILAELAAIRARHGDTASARAIFDELTERAKTSYVGPAVRASVAASAGDFDVARELLARAIEARDTYLTFYKLPGWRPLRANAECEALLQATAYVGSALK